MDNAAQVIEQPAEFQPTLGQLIDAFVELDAARATAAAEEKKLKALADAAELKIIEALDKQGVQGTRIAGKQVTISEKNEPRAQDWDAFYAYIKDNDAFYLLQKRISSTAFNELKNSGEAIPGVDTFKKRTISLRKVS